jgi:hypothetical protein
MKLSAFVDGVGVLGPGFTDWNQCVAVLTAGAHAAADAGAAAAG